MNFFEFGIIVIVTSFLLAWVAGSFCGAREDKENELDR
jgi:hypothetical protein